MHQPTPEDFDCVIDVVTKMVQSIAESDLYQDYVMAIIDPVILRNHLNIYIRSHEPLTPLLIGKSGMNKRAIQQVAMIVANKYGIKVFVHIMPED